MRALESNSQKSDLTCEDDGLKSWRQVLGFVVADISLNPLYANNEAITILTYPGPPAESIVDVFRKKLRPPSFPTPEALGKSGMVHMPSPH
jgi:hypothetical protein